MTIRRQYITGQDAIDVARLTELPLGHLLDRKWRPCIHPNAVVGPMRDLVYIDLTRLDWWDRLRVAWARIGAHYYVKEVPCGSSSASQVYLFSTSRSPSLREAHASSP